MKTDCIDSPATLPCLKTKLCSRKTMKASSCKRGRYKRNTREAGARKQPQSAEMAAHFLWAILIVSRQIEFSVTPFPTSGSSWNREAGKEEFGIALPCAVQWRFPKLTSKPVSFTLKAVSFTFCVVTGNRLSIWPWF